MTTHPTREGAIRELNRLAETPEHAMAVLQALETKRKEEQFIKYWQPFDYEQKVFDAFTEDIKILVVAGGNRSGKTEVGAGITVAFAEGKDYFAGEPAMKWVSKLPIPNKKAKNIWIVGLDYNMMRDVIWREKLMTGAVHPGFIPKDDSIVNIRHDDKQIFFRNSAVITGKSADSGREKFQSASVDLIWIDEECDAEIFDECYQRTIDCGGRIIVTVTPLTDIASGIKQPWIFDLYEDMKAGRKDIKFVNLSVLDNPTVTEIEKQKAIEKWAGHPEERARLYGEFVRRTGMVYPMWDRKIHLVRPRLPDASWMRVVSIDPAATGITAALFAAIDPGGNIHLYREYYKPDLVVSEHAINIRQMRAGDVVDVWLIDPKWGAQRNAETHKSGQQLYRDAGIPVRLAVVGEDYGLAASLEYMNATTLEGKSRHPKVWVNSDLDNFISEIEHYTYDMFRSGPMKGMSKEKPIKRNDHLMNAYQYLCAMKPRPKERLEKMYSDEELARRAQANSYF